MLVHARCPLLGHHTSGVRKEWYREDLEAHKKLDPAERLRALLLESGESVARVQQIGVRGSGKAESDFRRAVSAPEPDPDGHNAVTRKSQSTS